jgi:hypothetical protein
VITFLLFGLIVFSFAAGYGTTETSPRRLATAGAGPAGLLRIFPPYRCKPGVIMVKSRDRRGGLPDSYPGIDAAGCFKPESDGLTTDDHP